MRRVLTIMLILGLVAVSAAAPAAAAKKKKKKATVRTFEVRYENPAFGFGGVVGGCSGCPAVPVGPSETFATIVVEDDVSPRSYVSFAYDQDGDGIQDFQFAVCGATEEPIPVEPGVSYTAWPWVAGADCPGSSSFAGTIKVKFSSDPARLK